MPKRKRTAYDNAFKICVIKFAETSNNCAAEREFGVSEKLVRDWRKSKNKILNGPKSLKHRVVRVSPYDGLETDLLKWLLELRESGFVVTSNAIRIKALHLAKDAKYSIETGVFKASEGWCSRFMNRHGLSLPQRTRNFESLLKIQNISNAIMSIE
jgi:transposase-like protein